MRALRCFVLSYTGIALNLTSRNSPGNYSSSMAAPASTTSRCGRISHTSSRQADTSFIAYRVAGRVALALGDPVGPPDEIDQVIRAFIAFCEENDWSPAFYQTTAEYLFHYRSVGLHRLKVGDDGFVDLTASVSMANP